MHSYRPEIDGLLTIAILPVVFFHAGFPGFGGGFLGVDIFFVISGYLITGLILKELAAGTFSFARFYERRIRRILPALYFVAAISLFLALFFLFSFEFKAFCDSILAMLAFCSNIYFYFSIDYFNPTAEFAPFLHTWSLSVEEQYYLVFPLFMVLLWKYGKRMILPALCIVFLASFVIAGWGKPFSAQAKFYLPWFRVWELGVGALCAAVHPKMPQLPSLVKQAASLAGLALIVHALTSFDSSRSFPGVRFALPMFGVACVILFTRTRIPDVAPQQSSFFSRQRHRFTAVCDRNIVSYLLSIPPMVGIGLISYSLYLWHNPLFTFAKLSGFKPGHWFFIILSLVSLCAAYFSWRFVERPFRDRQKMHAKKVCVLVGSGTVFLFVMAFAGGKIGKTFFVVDQDLIMSADERAAYCMAGFQQNTKPFSNSKARKVLIVGDSQAQDIFNMMKEGGLLDDFETKTHHIPGICQIDYTSKRDDNILEENRKECAAYTLEKLNDMTRHADIIIMGAWWREAAIDHLPETLALMDIKPGAEVVLFGPKATSQVKPRDYVKIPKEKRFGKRVVPSSFFIKLAPKIAAVPGTKYVDLYSRFCDDSISQCSIFTEEGNLIFWDDLHLTQEGARHFGRLMATDPYLRQFAPKPTNE